MVELPRFEPGSIMLNYVCSKVYEYTRGLLTKSQHFDKKMKIKKQIVSISE